MTMIRAIRMTPGRPPMLTEIGSDLRSLQHEVSGGIELVSLDSKTDAYVNDEGLLRQLEFNCMLPTDHYGEVPVVGTVIVVSHDGEGDTVGLSDEQISKWLVRLANAPRDLSALAAAMWG